MARVSDGDLWSSDARLESHLAESHHITMRLSIVRIMLPAFAWVMMSPVAGTGSDARPESREGEVPAGGVRAGGPSLDASIARLVRRMDSRVFAERRQAMRELAEFGTTVIPRLVDSLESDSDELKARARSLLDTHDFQELVVRYGRRSEIPLGPGGQAYIRGRGRRRLEVACQAARAELLFKIWRTEPHKFINPIMARWENSQARAEFSDGLDQVQWILDQMGQFGELTGQLADLRLSIDQQDGPARMILTVFAEGLRDGSVDKVAFARAYVHSCETLASQFGSAVESTRAGRREVGHRAGWSRGALAFLIRQFQAESPDAVLLIERCDASPETLRAEFLRALAAPRSEEFMRGVGKSHVAEMLCDTIRAWPDAPVDGVVGELIAAIRASIASGDKSRALCCLDAVQACRGIKARGFDLDSGLGRDLAERLMRRALSADAPRAFHATRSTHDRFMSLIANGIAPASPGFPDPLLEAHLGLDADLTDDQRLALERYVRITDRLVRWGVPCGESGPTRFLGVLRAMSVGSSNQLAAASSDLDEIERDEADAIRRKDSAALAARLNLWADEQGR